MYTILGPDGPATLILNGDQYIVGVAVDPPIGPITSLSLGDVYQQAMALLR